ncbi:hypothetical protein OAA15_00155 [bacterium]|nr:hypothetical protein [bacterium]
MSITIFGGTKIQPLEAYVSASQQKTVFTFISEDSGSYIYSGSNPDLIISGSPLPHHTSSLTFEDSGSIYSFVFSGSGFELPSPPLPGIILSASINGLTTPASIAAAFTASVVSSTNMTASISNGNVVTLCNSAFSSSAGVTSSFAGNTLFAFTSQSGNPVGYLSGSSTTGSLELTGSLTMTGSIIVDGTIEISGSGPIGGIPTGSFATTGSNIFSGSQEVSGSTLIDGDFEIQRGSITFGSKGLSLVDVTHAGNYSCGGAITADNVTVNYYQYNSHSIINGTGSLSGGNLLITSSIGGIPASFITLTRTGGGTPSNYGELYISTQSMHSAIRHFTVSSSNAADDGDFRYFIMVGV